MFKSLMMLVAGLLVIGLVLMTAVSRSETLQGKLVYRAATAGMSQRFEVTDGLTVMMCGTASPLGNNPDRAQACVAVLTPEHFVVIDSGSGSAGRLVTAGMPLDRLQAVFLTHFHSDHITSLPDLNLNSWVAGRSWPLELVGPDGIGKIAEGYNLAFELDRGYRIAHHGPALLPPEAGSMTASVLRPGGQWIRDDLVITSFAVDHSPVEPAVGYRIDYRGRSVVVSGDTVVTDSLAEAAENADLLFHDALNRQILSVMTQAATDANRPRIAQIMRDVVDYHADASQLEAMATAAGVRQLVLYHMVPNPDNFVLEQMFRHAVSRETLLAEDKLVFRLPPDSDQIIVDRSAL